MFKLIQESDDLSLLQEPQWRIIVDRLMFSPREMEIVQFIMEDLKESTIARRLGISSHTVHTHLKRLYVKLGVNSRVELILCLFREYIATTRSEAATSQTLPLQPIRKAA